ncbi:hypothetical protein [Pseudomonas sp. FP2338]|uniref:hypothetical protein n=1 Tax=Pseudomonas sp. FP2338 TaxID=2954093 RepID=UPI0027365283|nr:hypothetical protein [Pseudomonas sp. FP2338]WLH85043.1 hypothetical protein PSH96_00955 [Pseudomonas sp. FP2338]
MTGKQKPKLADLVKKTEVDTSIGPLYVRNFTARDMDVVAEATWPDDLNAAGLLVLGRILSRDSENYDAPAIHQEELERLTPEDIASLLPIAYRHCGVENLEGSESVAGLGKAVEMQVERFTKNTNEMLERFRTVVAPETVTRFKSSLDGLQSLTDRIRVSTIRPGPKDRIQRSSPVELLQGQNGVPFFQDIAVPAERSAQAAEKSLETLTEMSGELLRMAAAIGDATTSVMRAVPEFMLHLEGNKRSASTAMRVTIGGLVFSALVSLGLTGWQVFLATEAGKSSDQQSAAVLAALRMQLEESRQAKTELTQQLQETQKQNEDLNAQLIIALEKMPPPVVKVIQQSVPINFPPSKDVNLQSKVPPR